ncbi:hypothetical protein VPNG_06772 [Cytospora leucostoma]|uniref:Alpha/beta hydrolase fold-3 domain-containing protein n=1 Tax=Cytospora leucostoma TaxID=1230097 RepID=A0A423WTL5_9PEZI|nr:hypothetical protein VPNG_06772 [Cytospora leucostoma]
MASATAGFGQTVQGIEDKVSHLHNVTEYPSTAPLIINLPAFPTHNVDDVDSYLPSFLHHFPTATIHYRWTNRRGSKALIPNHGRAASSHESSPRYKSAPLHWPTPLHDTIFGYEWLVKNLSPGPKLRRRTVYIHGSYLGAGLASSLALTESHTHKPMAVRGLLAFNGIYNWTRMLPDHPTNKILRENDDAMLPGAEAVGWGEDQDVAVLRDLTPALFRDPSDLFDPFASPMLFFHTAGMLIPPDFGDARSSSPSSPHQDSDVDADDDKLIDLIDDPPPPTPYEEDEDAADMTATDESGGGSRLSRIPEWPPQPLRKGYYAFPPRSSTLRVPETLLLHTSPATSLPDVAGAGGAALWHRYKNAENSFEAHALGLANLMRKSINKLELSERMMWDADFDGWASEAARRVGVGNVGRMVRDGKGDFGRCGLGEEGEDLVLRWLWDRLG